MDIKKHKMIYLIMANKTSGVCVLKNLGSSSKYRGAGARISYKCL